MNRKEASAINVFFVPEISDIKITDNTVIATSRCYECGSVTKGRKGEYKYLTMRVSSALIFHCPNCDRLEPYPHPSLGEIPMCPR